MAHRRSFRPRGRGISESQRRKKTWIAAKTTLAVTGAGAGFGTSIIISVPAPPTGIGDNNAVAFAFIDEGATTAGDEESTFPEECTILRTRGSLLFPKTTATIGSGGSPEAQFALGMGVTDIRSIVNGAFPGPIVDADWDGWMFMRQSTVTPVDSIGTVVDIKSMRKIKSGDALFITAQTMSGGGTGATTQQWQFDFRFLVLLP